MSDLIDAISLTAHSFYEERQQIADKKTNEKPASSIRKEREEKLNNSKKDGIIPEDVDKDVNSQIKKDFDEAIARELNGLSDAEREKEIEMLEEKSASIL